MKMTTIKVFFWLWMFLCVNCRRVPYRTQKKCNSTGNSFVNGNIKDDWHSGAKMYRKYQCRSEYVSNIPDLGDIIFRCRFIVRSYEWKATSAWFTEGGSLYLQNVTCEPRKKCSAPPLPKDKGMIREITTRFLIPVTINGVKKAINDFYTGDTVKYSCKPSYILSNDVDTLLLSDYNYYDYNESSSSSTTTAESDPILNDITCNVDGFWNGFPDSELFFGECQAIECDATPYADISHGYITNYKRTYKFLEVMKLECDDGYRQNGGVKSALCMTPSSFSNFFLSDFGCERIHCIEPESPSNGFLRIDHSFVNGTVIFECEYGYDLIGYPEWRCQSNGKWDHDCVKCASEDSFEVSCGLTKPQLTSLSNPSENRYEVDAKRNAWPWMAELQSLNGHVCGGSLIMEQWILTSAHCVFQKVSKVYLRKLKLNDQNSFEEREILQKNIYVHPEYNDKNKPKKLYDIALVKLDKRIDRIPELLPVCLWDKTMHNKAKVTYKKLFTETYGVVTGWGKRNTTSTKYAGTLKQMQMEVKSSKECLENLTPREKVDVSTELMFCAGGKEKVDDKVQNIDACEGDNGGPFVVPHPLEENKFLQIGIFSFGFGCKENGRYGFYTKLTEELLSWINSTIQKEKDIE